MRKVFFPVLLGSLFLFVLVRMISMGPGARVVAQTANPDPANEHGCPSQTGAGGGALEYSLATTIPTEPGLGRRTRGLGGS